MRVLIYGNSGSGKSTLARRLSESQSLAMLDLDTITWVPNCPGERREPEESFALLDTYIDAHSRWVIEGCYASLIERALPRCTQLVFLDPGVEACQRNNRERAWEPHKYPSPAAQDAALDFLQQWVAQYYERDDEYSHARHLAIYEGFTGGKERRS